MAFNIVKVVNIVGTVLGITGSMFTAWSSQKAMKEAVAKEVAEALAKQMNK